jgi:phosphate transport system substrate-binding protein
MRPPYVADVTKRLLLILLSLALLGAACGGDDSASSNDKTTTTAAGGGDASDVAGDVVISGSSTVEPISIAVSEAFAEIAPDVTVNVDGPGTGDGFKLFCSGETDISDASRQIKDEEAAACADAGIEYVELKIAFDGLTVMTNPANDSVSCLTKADLYALAGPESQGVASWKDAQALATELGSSTELPDLDLTMVAPGEESGTYDSFVELAYKSIAEGRVEAGKITEDQIATSRPDYQASADDNVIIQGIEGADGSFGWVGFAFAQEAGDQIKELEVDGGDGCVGPSADTIADGSYPLSRSLYLYVNKAKAEENPAVAAYVDFYLGDGLTAVADVGYIALPDDQVAETQSAWEAR